MGFLRDGDAVKLLQNSEFVDEIIAKVLSDPRAISDLADEVADQLEDALDENGNVKDMILSAASGNDDFRARVIEKLSQKLG